MRNGTTHSTAEATGRALILHPYVKAAAKSAAARSADARLAEAVGLARAIALEVARAEIVPVAAPRPATLFGQGKVDELAAAVAAAEVDVVVVDGALSPVQQRNLERAWNAKVIDRTGLILEIFGARAATREGRLQVELAQLSYQRTRLVRSWSHLERQRGGLGKTGGPGETQLEIDRRLIDERITKLKRELKDVVRTRELHRKTRRQVPYPVVALVGYTNAGKSTLFNRLTEASVRSEDLLFATLDPTMRAAMLPSGRRIILSDTVGFISDLPTHLVAAFRATLEEVLEADLIVHVRDVSHPDSEAQAEDVLTVLAGLGVGEAERDQVIEAWNKIDRLDPEQRSSLANMLERREDAVAISALTGEGSDALLRLVDRRLGHERQVVDVDVDIADGAAMAWLYRHGTVLRRHDLNGSARLCVSLDPADLGRLRKRAGIAIHTG